MTLIYALDGAVILLSHAAIHTAAAALRRIITVFVCLRSNELRDNKII